MYKKFLLLALIVIGAYAQEATTTASNSTANTAGSEEAKIQEKFDRFCRKWRKNYTTPEEKAKRFHIFRHNYKMSKVMINGSGQAAFGITKFFDMEISEFEKSYGGLSVDFVDMMKAEVQFEDYSEAVMERKTTTIEEQSSTNSTNSTEGLRHLDEYVYTNDQDYESDDPNDDPNWDLPDPFAYRNISVMVDAEQAKNLRTVPSTWDWRARGSVSYVRNQGVCGACWAFSVVANIEGLYYNKHKQMKILSEQELLDCNTNNSGCSGGTLPIAFSYVKAAGGIALRNTYPYVGRQTGCRVVSEEKFGTIKGFVSPGMNEEDIKNMLYSKGPLSAAINSKPLYFYRGGVYSPTEAECNPYGVNHGVVIVGYGTQDGVDYWIIKNSWGPNWGEKGFFRIRRGTGACGINRMVYSGVLH